MPTPHPLFTRYPLSGEYVISTGSVPVPYQVYAGHGTLIGGTIDAELATEWLRGQDLVPVETSSGRVPAGFWVCNFTDASLGPHSELQLFVAAARDPKLTTRLALPLEDHPLALLRGLLRDPDLLLYCHRLWNNSRTTVAYNRELLGLDAAICDSDIRLENGRLSFTFRDGMGGLLVEGSVRRERRTSLWVMLELVRLLGMGSRSSAAQEAIVTRVANPKGIAFDDNRAATAALAADDLIVQLWDHAADRLAFATEGVSGRFAPTFVEHMTPYRFVYLMPEPLAA